MDLNPEIRKDEIVHCYCCGTPYARAKKDLYRYDKLCKAENFEKCGDNIIEVDAVMKCAYCGGVPMVVNHRQREYANKLRKEHQGSVYFARKGRGK